MSLVSPQGSHPQTELAELCSLLKEAVRLGEECGDLGLANAKVIVSHIYKHALRKL